MEKFEDFTRFIRKEAIKMANNKDEVEDLIQSGFLGLLKAQKNLKENSFTEGEKISYLLEGILQEMKRSRFRMMTPVRVPFRKLEEAWAIGPGLPLEDKNEDGEEYTPSYIPKVDMEEQILHIDLKNAIRGLPLEWQKIINYRFFGGYTLEETAQCLNLTPEGVRIKEKKALASLKKRLGGNMPPGLF